MDAGFELLAASLRADAQDLSTLVEVLAPKLEAAVPGGVRVERKGFSGRGRVRAIDVDLGEHRYRLEANGPTATRTRIVRGIALKNERLGLDDWIDGLARDLALAAERSERDRVAIERLLRG